MRPATASPREDLPAVQAADPVHRAVQLDDAREPARTCRPSTFCVMTPVDDARRFEVGERAVTGVRAAAREAPPAEVAAGPVALAGASASRGTVWTVIGVRTGAPSPR